MLVCGRCGHHNPESARFCASCDTYLDFSTSRKVDDQQGAQEPTAPAPPPRQHPATPGPAVTPPAAGQPDPHAAAARRGDPWGSRPDGPASPAGARQDLFGADDDYGTLLDDLAALGYGPDDRASAAAAVARETPPDWPGGGQDQPPQPHREPPWPPPEQEPYRPEPARGYRPGPAEAVLPQAVQPQRRSPAPQPAAPDQDEGIHAVLPAERRQPSVARSTAPEQAQPAAVGLRPGEVPCPSCGRPNPQDRRFCRCGHQLARQAPPTRPAPLATTTRQVYVPWWKRLLGVAGDGRSGAAGTARVQYNRALELRTRVVRATLLLGGLGLGVSLIGPFGVRDWALDQFANLSQRYNAVGIQASAVVPEQEEPEGFSAAFATDGQPDRAWAVSRDPEAEVVVDEPCSTETGAAAGALSVTFAQQARVDRIVVRAGLDRERDLAAKQAAPKTIDVRFSDSSCQRLELKNEFGAQRFKVETGDVTGATVTIVDVYPQVDGPGDLVALSEVTFETRR